MGVRLLPDRQDGPGSAPDGRRDCRSGPRARARARHAATTSFNIVLMGMGEPLHNYDETMKALRMLDNEHGLGVSPRRVTLSTVGLVPMLDKLAAEQLMPNLAISLHATTEEQRAAIVPPTKKYSLQRHPRGVPAFPASPSAAASRSSTCCSTASTTRPTMRGAWRAARRHQGQGQPDPAERRARHPVRAAVRRARRPLRAHPRRPRRHGVGAQEPRPRHPRRLRSADRRRSRSPLAAQQLSEALGS